MHFPTSNFISLTHLLIFPFLAVTAWPPDSRARPPHAGGAEEWRDAEWTFGYMRYVDEFDVEGGGADESGGFLGFLLWGL